MKQHTFVLSQALRRLVLLLLLLFDCSYSEAKHYVPQLGSTSKENSQLKIPDCGEGSLLVVSGASKGKPAFCTLTHTDVKAVVSGYVSRVVVRQQFHNPFKNKIEALYTFPLPENSAVDQMTMRIGTRQIKGEIKRREEARKLYEEAKQDGHAAALLDQERPNVFTQSVANIAAGENIDVEISFVEYLHYEKGEFSFVFPTVVGPRFIPDKSTESELETSEDVLRISPPVLPCGQRSGQDISITVDIKEPFSVKNLKAQLHEIVVEQKTPNSALVRLKSMDKIPNRDFALKWTVASEKLESGCLFQRDADGGFFSLMMIPPLRTAPKEMAAKELIFLIDCSGSQSGAPIQKAKEAIKYILEHMNPQDRFRILSFNNNVTEFSADSQSVSDRVRKEACRYLDNLEASGGTWMGPAVERVCSLPNPDHLLRLVVFMTDGYVGNDLEIINTVQKYRKDTRWFPFGTGNSVNRFLIDSIAKEGGGEAEYVFLNSSATDVGRRFYERISSPVLTDIKLSSAERKISDVYPPSASDLWAQRPLYFTGRYSKPGRNKFVLTGFACGKPYRQELELELPEEENGNESIKSVWARAKVEALMSCDWLGLQNDKIRPTIESEIIDTALRFHLMSRFTSFVAVEKRSEDSPGIPQQLRVPLELPEGVQNSAIGYNSRSSANYSGTGSQASVFSRTLALGSRLSLKKQLGEGQNAYYIAGGSCQPFFLEGDYRTIMLGEKGCSFQASKRHIYLHQGKIFSIVDREAIEVSTVFGKIQIPAHAALSVELSACGVLRIDYLKGEKPLLFIIGQQKTFTLSPGEGLCIARDSLIGEELVRVDGVDRKNLPVEPLAGFKISYYLFDRLMMIEREKLLVCNVGSFYIAKALVNRLKEEITSSCKPLFPERHKSAQPH